MSEQKEQGIPQVTVSIWPTCAMPEREVRASLMYLAHKTGKPVRFSKYLGKAKYSSRFVNVYVCTRENCGNASRIETVKLNGEELSLSENQPGFCFDSPNEEEEQYVQDENATILAIVCRNSILIRIEITGEDNTAGRAILAYVVEQAIPFLDFSGDDQIESRQDEMQKRFVEFFGKSLSSRVEGKKNELAQAERDAETHYHGLIGAEQAKIALSEELKALEKLQRRPRNDLASKQGKAIVELEENGLYEEIDFRADGSLRAVTGEIVIEYADWTFPMGQYEIRIDARGKVTINALKEHPQTDYPHPHISDSGNPCLGNIHADVGRMIGQFRIAESLQVLHQFLLSYEPGGAYVKIGKFDETGDFDDPDDDPCEDCDDKYTPYCIGSCEQNNGWYTCDDCNECRSDYCYEECQYNQDMSPCDDCEYSAGEERCFAECEANRDWRWQSPCFSYCQRKECVEYECKWYKRNLEIAGASGKFDRSKAPEFIRDYTLEDPEDEPNPDWQGGEAEGGEGRKEAIGVGTSQ